MYEAKIEKLDNFGRGICYINEKITFVENALKNEIVQIKITKENKKYNEAKVIKYLKQSSQRKNSICPYYENCGGCNLLHLTYEDSIKFKKEKLENIISKYANIKKDITIIPSENPLNYRNKITLKIINKKVGFYKTKTHELVEIKNCLLAEKPLQKFIKDIKFLNITNGNLTIRCNYNSELLISITTKDKITIDIAYLKAHHKITGIILNDKTIYNDNFFIEKINNKLFTVSYDSFFQINHFICEKLFSISSSYIQNNEIVLDLYCGVGTLGINVASKAQKVYGIEIVKNAILNAVKNANINKAKNTFYQLGDVTKCLPKIKDKIDTIIVDPPRAGLNQQTIKTIISFKPSKIIYISCDPMTLARDLKLLSATYNVENITGLDMFPYTYHIETICLLTIK